MYSLILLLPVTSLFERISERLPQAFQKQGRTAAVPSVARAPPRLWPVQMTRLGCRPPDSSSRALARCRWGLLSSMTDANCCRKPAPQSDHRSALMHDSELVLPRKVMRKGIQPQTAYQAPLLVPKYTIQATLHVMCFYSFKHCARVDNKNSTSNDLCGPRNTPESTPSPEKQGRHLRTCVGLGARAGAGQEVNVAPDELQVLQPVLRALRAPEAEHRCAGLDPAHMYLYDRLSLRHTCSDGRYILRIHNDKTY